MPVSDLLSDGAVGDLGSAMLKVRQSDVDRTTSRNEQVADSTTQASLMPRRCPEMPFGAPPQRSESRFENAASKAAIYVLLIGVAISALFLMLLMNPVPLRASGKCKS
jgi:tetrahydromethanopterin S-methyltransferase subunit B